MESSFLIFVVIGLCVYSLIVGFWLFEELLRQFLGASVNYYRPVTLILYGNILLFTFYPKESIQMWIAIFRKIWRK
jgi:hypothetical protein